MSEMSMEMAYKTLGVSSTMSIGDIKKVYRTLSKKYHPDVIGDNDMFKDISIAWNLIEKNHEVFIQRSKLRFVHKTIFSIRRG